MDVSKTASPEEKAADPDTAEEICELLKQTMLKYFPQDGGNCGRPRSAVPLVARHPKDPVPERKRWSPIVSPEK